MATTSRKKSEDLGALLDDQLDKKYLAGHIEL
jgi:hypothetical protein